VRVNAALEIKMKPIQLSRKQLVFITLALLWVVLSASLAGTVMYAAWDHNPQGEYHENGTTNWGDLLLLGAPVFLFAGGPFALVMLGYFLFSAFRASRVTSSNSPLHTDPLGR